MLDIKLGCIIAFGKILTFQIHCLDDASSLTLKGQPTSTNTATLMTYKSEYLVLEGPLYTDMSKKSKDRLRDPAL